MFIYSTKEFNVDTKRRHLSQVMPPLPNAPSIDLLPLWTAVNTTLSTVPHVAIENLDCGFEGDDNIYGLGIRLAFYTQWLSAILLTVFIPGNTRSRQNFDVSMAFTFSTFVALIYIINTRPPSALYASEVFIIYSLCICGSISGGILMGLYSDLECAGKITKLQDGSAPQYGPIVISLTVALDTAITSFSLWFWFTGIDNMARSPCSRFAFFFAKVDLYHWFRTFGKVFSIIWGAVMCIKLIVLGRVFRRIRARKAAPVPVEPQNKTWNRIRRFLPFTKFDGRVAEKRRFRLFPGISQLPTVALFILGVELPIRWNHIEGVNIVASTGQLIPLVVALVGLISAIYEILFGDRKNRTSGESNQPDRVSEPLSSDVAEEKIQPIASPSPNDELGLRPLDYGSGVSSSTPPPISPLTAQS